MNEAAWRAARRILCVRLDTVGDVLMTTPAIRALRHSGRGRDVTLLASSHGAAIAPLVPEIDDVIAYDAPWMRTTGVRGDPTAEYLLADRLRTRHFDAAVVFTPYAQSSLPAALLLFLARVPLRLAHAREDPCALLTDWVSETEPEKQVRHEVRRQLDLVAAVGARTSDDHLSLRVPPAARARTQHLLRLGGVRPDEPYVVVHPGAAAPARRYGADGFAAVVRRLRDEDGLTVVFTGDAGERDLVAAVRDLVPPSTVDLAGQLRLADLAALIDDAVLVLTTNAAPAHIAAAVGTPVVDLYALTDPQCAPWAVPSRVLYHDVPCKYCRESVCPLEHHDCLARVSPDEVVTAARELLPLAGRLAA